jgi:hypothetical protein
MKASELRKIAATKRTGLPMRKEEVELEEAEKKIPAGSYWSSYNNGRVTKMYTPGTRVKTKYGVGIIKSAHSSMDFQDDNDSHYKVNVNGKMHDIHADDLLDKKMGPKRINVKEEIVSEADDAVSKQIAAKKDAMQKQIRQKIAQKQMSVLQQKAQKKIQTIKAGTEKCSCDNTNESKMKCEVHGGNMNGIKGGKEAIVVNPPLREASKTKY